MISRDIINCFIILVAFGLILKTGKEYVLLCKELIVYIVIMGAVFIDIVQLIVKRNLKWNAICADILYMLVFCGCLIPKLL